ncbi:hypothetical protein PPSIR1_21659 [Plesiocystis pacifica SIR-1]|uniref:Uncharacterized protein n=1 Tax=Plesiocystis pacifica SIR-1 TaxID=391625 RepID=A6FXH9_9BACT|nr:hypothetical protein PPSIR1_21659 [Plesiocystis pacifica SIR-1]
MTSSGQPELSRGSPLVGSESTSGEMPMSKTAARDAAAMMSRWRTSGTWRCPPALLSISKRVFGCAGATASTSLRCAA